MRALALLPLLFALCLSLPALAQEAATGAPSLGAQLMAQVVPQLIVALGCLLGVLVVALKSRLAKSIAESKMGAAAQAALGWASSLAFELVLAGIQTTAEGLKKSLADGKISPEEYKALMQDLKRTAVEKLQSATVGRLISSGAVGSTGEAATLAGDLVEAAVAKTKALAPANPPVPPPG